jgi:hypothetical protein
VIRARRILSTGGDTVIRACHLQHLVGQDVKAATDELDRLGYEYSGQEPYAGMGRDRPTYYVHIRNGQKITVHHSADFTVQKIENRYE